MGRSGKWMVRVLVLVALVLAAQTGAQAQRVAPMGLALCVGINKYPLLEDLRSCREDALAVGQALKGRGYRYVMVLMDGAKDWEGRATLANIESQITQLSQLAKRQDCLIVFFSGHCLEVDGKPVLVPSMGDGDVSIPLEWVLETMGDSKAGSKLLIVDAAKGVGGVAACFEKTKAAARPTVLLSTKAGELSQVDKDGRHVFAKLLLEALEGKADRNGDKQLTQAELSSYVSEKSGKSQTPQMLLGAEAAKVPLAIRVHPLRKGMARIHFVMHRQMAMSVGGTSREFWKFNNFPIDFTYKFGPSPDGYGAFKNETHETVYVAELPAGDYNASQEKWEHKTNMGNYVGGPYKPLRLRVSAGDHELKQFNKQRGMSPHGKGIIFWDGERLCRTDSATKVVEWDIEIEIADSKGPVGGQVRGALSAGDGQRKAKLYAMALKQFKGALQKAHKDGNRVLVAEASKAMAWLLATAQDDAFRDAKKAMAFAEQAVMLAEELKLPDLWSYKDTLAAALAESGRFDEATRAVNDAIALAKGARPPVLPYIMKPVEARLDLYKSKKPCRE